MGVLIRNPVPKKSAKMERGGRPAEAAAAGRTAVRAVRVHLACHATAPPRPGAPRGDLSPPAQEGLDHIGILATQDLLHELDHKGELQVAQPLQPVRETLSNL